MVSLPTTKPSSTGFQQGRFQQGFLYGHSRWRSTALGPGEVWPGLSSRPEPPQAAGRYAFEPRARRVGSFATIGSGAAGLRPLEDLGTEIIYSLAPHAWGRGYATEAARAVLEYALGPLRLPEVLAEVDEGNTASAGVLERLGMSRFQVVPGLLGPVARYRLAAASRAGCG